MMIVALAFAHCALHVVIASTQCFDKSVMQTVTRDNINPIEKVFVVVVFFLIYYHVTIFDSLSSTLRPKRLRL